MPYTRRGSILRLLPLALPMGVLFAAGAGVTVAQSFGYLVPVSGGESSTAWARLLNDRWIWTSVLHSLVVAVVSAGISVAVGTVLAWTIHRLPTSWRPLVSVYKIPLILPHLTVAYIAILLFSRTGALSALAFRLGLIESTGDFPNILYSGHGAGVALAYVMKETSFVILMVSGLLAKLDESLVASAEMLGARRYHVFRDIVLPHVRPATRSSFVILSLYALGAFEIPWLIGESHPQMLSITIYNLYFQRDLSRRPEAAALLTILMVISVLFIFVFLLTYRKKEDR